MDRGRVESPTLPRPQLRPPPAASAAARLIWPCEADGCEARFLRPPLSARSAAAGPKIAFFIIETLQASLVVWLHPLDRRCALV